MYIFRKDKALTRDSVQIRITWISGEKKTIDIFLGKINLIYLILYYKYIWYQTIYAHK